jgi:hypothetical protein
MPVERAGAVVERSLGRRRRVLATVLGHVREASYFAGIGVIYLILAIFFEGTPARARSNAVDLIQLERHIGIFIEPRWEEFVLPHEWLVDISNVVYFWGHAPVLAVFFLFLYIRRPKSDGARKAYQTFRTGFVVAELTGMAIYVNFPVTPPRLMGERWGFTDTLALRGGDPYTEGDLLVNTFSALPSLHFAWVVLVAVALIRLNRWLFPLAIVLPFASVCSIVVTANHYIVDAAGGGLVATFALVVAAVFTDQRIGRLWQRIRLRLESARHRRRDTQPVT